MSDDQREPLSRYVDAAAQLTGMPLTPERRQAVAAVLTRVATFAAHLESFELTTENESASGAGSAP